LSIIVSITCVDSVTSTRKESGPHVTITGTGEPLKRLGFGLLPKISILYKLESISVVILLHAWALLGLASSGVHLIVKLTLKVDACWGGVDGGSSPSDKTLLLLLSIIHSKLSEPDGPLFLSFIKELESRASSACT
jgi:hypothetical protein